MADITLLDDNLHFQTQTWYLTGLISPVKNMFLVEVFSLYPDIQLNEI